MIASLMRSRRFAPMFWCQFFAALGDNFLKNTLALLVLFELGKEEGGAAATLAGALFILPSFFLSALGGELADRFDKAQSRPKREACRDGGRDARGGRHLLARHPLDVRGPLPVRRAVCALRPGEIRHPSRSAPRERAHGRQCAYRGRDLRRRSFSARSAAASRRRTSTRLSRERTSSSPSCSSRSRSPLMVSSLFIRPTGPAAPELEITRNPLASTLSLVLSLRVERRLWIGAMVVSWFWLVGFMAIVAPAAARANRLQRQRICDQPVPDGLRHRRRARLIPRRQGESREHPNLALVPLGAALMAIFCLDIAWIAVKSAVSPELLSPVAFLLSTRGWHLLAGLFGLAFAGGLFIVPSFAQGPGLGGPANARPRRRRGQRDLGRISWRAPASSSALPRKPASALTPLFLVLGIGNLAAMRARSCAPGARRACATSAASCSAPCFASSCAASTTCRPPARAW